MIMNYSMKECHRLIREATGKSRTSHVKRAIKDERRELLLEPKDKLLRFGKHVISLHRDDSRH